MKLVSIITINYNSSPVTESLLESLKTINGYAPLEVIVVDNASKINPIPRWKQQYPEYRFFRSNVNLGFAGGNNMGIAMAKGDYFFLINNDTEVTADLIEKLVATMEANPRVGMISPKIRYFDEPSRIQYAGFTEMNYWTGRNVGIGSFQEDKGQFDNIVGKTGYIHGAAMMIRRAAAEKAGLMDETFFLYYEELDWCERIKKAGFEAWVNLQALIYHKESVSVGKKSSTKEYFMNRNRIFFLRKHAPWHCCLFFYVYFLFVVMPRNVISYLRHKDYANIPLLFKAVFWNLTHKISPKQTPLCVRQKEPAL